MSWDADRNALLRRLSTCRSLQMYILNRATGEYFPHTGCMRAMLMDLSSKILSLDILLRMRPAVVFDDVHDGLLKNCELMACEDSAHIVLVDNSYKRPTGFEYVPDYPYHATDNAVTGNFRDMTGRTTGSRRCLSMRLHREHRRDSLYAYPTRPGGRQG